MTFSKLICFDPIDQLRLEYNMNGILSKLAGAKCPNSMISFSTDIELNCFLAIFLSKVVVDASEKVSLQLCIGDIRNSRSF